MLSQTLVDRLDSNNTKALAVVELTITTLENGIDNIKVVETLEVIRDYLRCNEILFDKCECTEVCC